MVVRDDQGGLGNLTYRAWRELRPAVTLVVQWRPCRGVPNPDRFVAPWTRTVFTDRPVPDVTWAELAGEADVWWTAESWYSDNAETILRDAGCRTVFYAMPELFKGSQADEVWNPTRYLTDRPRLGDVVPWPLSPSDTWTVRTTIRRVLHVSGGATGDRNGTQAFMEALRHVRSEVEVLLHQPEPRHRVPARKLRSVPSNVNIKQTDLYFPNLLSAIRWADLLVLPRRYAGLCLPALEAMGDGCPVVMPEAAPQTDWPVITVPAVQGPGIRLHGGDVPTWETDPVVLADVLDDLRADTVPVIAHRSAGVRRWAEGQAWSGPAGNVWRARLWASRL